MDSVEDVIRHKGKSSQIFLLNLHHFSLYRLFNCRYHRCRHLYSLSDSGLQNFANRCHSISIWYYYQNLLKKRLNFVLNYYLFGIAFAPVDETLVLQSVKVNLQPLTFDLFPLTFFLGYVTEKAELYLKPEGLRPGSWEARKQ